MAKKSVGEVIALGLLCSATPAAVPDQAGAFDPGGRSMGAGGAFYATNADTLSVFYNPAGLGYLRRRGVEIAFRNLPGSRTSVSNTLANPARSSRGTSGSTSITHVGYAIPTRGSSGTLAVAYTVGGFIDDVGRGPASGLPSGTGAFTVDNFVERSRAKSEYLTVGYGATNSVGDLAYGIGLIYLRQSLDYSQSGTSAAPGFGSFSVSSDGNGFGVVGGVQYNPPKLANLSLGASVRSPIDLNDNSATSALLDRMPGRALLGAAYRYDGLRGGKDFAVAGLQFQQFFGGRGSSPFDASGQTVTGIGLEYSYDLGSARLPLRIGHVSSQGDGGFGSRDRFTYGFGYRPNSSDFSIDLSWAQPRGGGHDFAVTASFQFH
jgi:hypothetical protein